MGGNGNGSGGKGGISRHSRPLRAGTGNYDFDEKPVIHGIKRIPKHFDTICRILT